jgi:hypothetical protein
MNSKLGFSFGHGMYFLLVCCNPLFGQDTPEPTATDQQAPVTNTKEEFHPLWELAKIVVPVAGAITAVLLAAKAAFDKWRIENFTNRWYELMKYLHEHPQYMDPAKNQDYKNKFTDDAKWQYESIARMCIAYVDDVYFLDPCTNFEKWFRGTIPLLVGRHRKWFEDNQDSYAPEFIRYVNAVLDQPRP